MPNIPFRLPALLFPLVAALVCILAPGLLAESRPSDTTSMTAPAAIPGKIAPPATVAPAPAFRSVRAVEPASAFATPPAPPPSPVAPPAPAPSGPVSAGQAQIPAEFAAYKEDVINAGDLVRVRMVEDPLVTFEGLVSASGTVPVPFLGEFFIARQTPTEASAALSAELTRSIYEKATIAVTLVTKGAGKVYVYGAVRRPGVVAMPTLGGLSIIQVMSYVEGLTSWASPEVTFIIRRGKPGEAPTKIDVNLKKVFASGETFLTDDVQLQSEDIICVPGVDGNLFLSMDTCEVIVTGEVRVPGIVQFAPGEQRTLMRAILKAGGFSKFAKTGKVRLVRYEKGKERYEKTIDASRIIQEGIIDEDVDLKPGDMIIVPQSAIVW